jgi:hypothetical protein
MKKRLEIDTFNGDLQLADALANGARMAYYVPIDAYIEGHGYRVSIVVEGLSGHYPTGDWPYTAGPSQRMPWFWGHDVEEARGHAERHNRRMGLSDLDVAAIITSSMAGQGRGRRKR